MKKLYSSHHLPLIGYLQGVLENEGIASIIRNEHLSGGVGELPPDACWPEIWVLEDADFERAKTVLVEHFDDDPGTPWTCPCCGELIDGVFQQCWNCGCEHP